MLVEDGEIERVVKLLVLEQLVLVLHASKAEGIDRLVLLAAFLEVLVKIFDALCRFKNRVWHRLYGGNRISSVGFLTRPEIDRF